jgi:hypothetical protein
MTQTEQIVKLESENKIEGIHYGWALRKGAGLHSNNFTLHYIPKEETLSFCGAYNMYDDFYKHKIIFLTEDQKHTELHKKCRNCLKTLPSYRKFGYLPLRNNRE